MRGFRIYEDYLVKMKVIYKDYFRENGDYPRWLRHEVDTYYWMFNAFRRLWASGTSGKQVLEMLDEYRKAPSLRFAKYSDINPRLAEVYHEFTQIVSQLYDDLLIQNGMWKVNGGLTYEGKCVLHNAAEKISGILDLSPDWEWRG